MLKFLVELKNVTYLHEKDAASRDDIYKFNLKS